MDIRHDHSGARFAIATTAIDAAPLTNRLRHSGAGGFCSFEGWVRDSNEGREVDGLEYEAYVELAISEGERIIAEALQRFGVTDARCVHRTGGLKIGDMAVWVGASAPHRDEAFRACRYIIDEIKHRLPIWKKEHYVTGETRWVACTHAYRAHEHEDVRGHAHHHHHDAPPPQFTPDYSRQTRLSEVGAAGQAKLAAARVLVIGAGGLGAPAISYLAGAGIGALGIVDGDRLDASNLHRQTIYAARDIGERKVDLAARHVAALNPSVQVQTYPQPLHAGNVVEVFSEYDLVLECTDDMRSRYLSSDAATVTGKPLVLASVYQYEGQLQVMDATPGSPCLRCLWPQPPSPEAVGSCVLSGVLGPAPGVLGTMQAMEALKLLLDLPRARADALVLVNLLDNTMQRLPIDPAAGCALHGSCIEQARRALDQSRTHAGLEQVFANLALAVDAGYRLVDLRGSEEIAAAPLEGVTALQISSGDVLARAGELEHGRVLLICASGRRSLHAAEQLRAAGFNEVYSLAGGVAALAQV